MINFRAEGSWENDKANGQIQMIYANGDKFQGTMQNNIKIGKGEIQYSNGTRFEGDF